MVRTSSAVRQGGVSVKTGTATANLTAVITVMNGTAIVCNTTLGMLHLKLHMQLLEGGGGCHLCLFRLFVSLLCNPKKQIGVYKF